MQTPIHRTQLDAVRVLEGVAMTNAVIVDAIRTPLGRRNGKLKDWHPVDLAAETLNALVERTGLDPAVVDDVVHGLRDAGRRAGGQRRPQCGARGGLARHVPGTTVDRQCGSSQQAAHFAAQGVIAGAYDVVVAAGVEVMTRVPMGSSLADGKFGFPFGPAIGRRYAEQGGLVPQGISAELIADKWDISRDDMDAFGARSQQRAARATAEGRFEREILGVRRRRRRHCHRRRRVEGDDASSRSPSSSRRSGPRKRVVG